MADIPDTWNTVIVGTIVEAGTGDGGGPLKAWFLRIRIDEQLRGPELTEPTIELYFDSIVHEFPELIGSSPHDDDYTAPLIGTRWRWALDITDTTVARWQRFRPPPA